MAGFLFRNTLIMFAFRASGEINKFYSQGHLSEVRAKHNFFLVFNVKRATSITYTKQNVFIKN